MLRMGRNVAKRITGENGKVVLIKESKLANIFGSNLATYFDLLIFILWNLTNDNPVFICW